MVDPVTQKDAKTHEPYAILVRPYGRTWRMEVLDSRGQILDYSIASTPRLVFGMALRSFKQLRSGKRQPRLRGLRSCGSVGYKPAQVDSVLTGVARATGATAAAVKRGKTITKYQHERAEP